MANLKISDLIALAAGDLDKSVDQLLVWDSTGLTAKKLSAARLGPYLSNWVDVKDYGPLNEATLQAAIDAHPSGGTLFFGAPCTVTGNFVFPTGWTIADGSYRIFTGAGTVDVCNLKNAFIPTEWGPDGLRLIRRKTDGSDASGDAEFRRGVNAPSCSIVGTSWPQLNFGSNANESIIPPAHSNWGSGLDQSGPQRDFVVCYQGMAWALHDGVLNSGSNVLNSPSEVTNFNPRAIGYGVVGDGIPAGTTITGVTDAHNVTLSQNATASGTGLRIRFVPPPGVSVTDQIRFQHYGFDPPRLDMLGYGVLFSDIGNGGWKDHWDSNLSVVCATGTDLAVDGVDPKKVTSATVDFNCSTGGWLDITAGTGWFTGRYYITSYGTGYALLDRPPAVAGSTGGTFVVNDGVIRRAGNRPGLWYACNRRTEINPYGPDYGWTNLISPQYFVNSEKTQGYFFGWNSYGGGGAGNGQIQIGAGTGGWRYLRIQNEYTNNTAYFDMPCDDDNQYIKFRARTDTPRTLLQLYGNGVITMPHYGAGTATFDASGNISSVSDERLKKIIGEFTPGLKEILGIKPIRYKWNKKSGLETKHTYAGFSAQDIQKNIPEAVHENKDGLLSINDRGILAAATNAIKELNAQINDLKAEVAQLKAQVAAQ